MLAALLASSTRRVRASGAWAKPAWVMLELDGCSTRCSFTRTVSLTPQRLKSGQPRDQAASSTSVSVTKQAGLPAAPSPPGH